MHQFEPKSNTCMGWRFGFILFLRVQLKIIFKGVSFGQGNAFRFVLNKYLPLWNLDKNSGLCRERLLTRERDVVGYLPRQEKKPLRAVVLGGIALQPRS